MTTIVLADDHPIVRRGLRAVLEGERDLQLVGETGDGLEALRLVERLNPDVLVADISMPGLSGLEIARQVSARHPQMGIVILSVHADESYILQALRHGARAYVLKDSGAEDLLKAIREVSTGRRYLSPSLAKFAIDAYVEKAKAAPLDLYETLTTREREVLHLAAEGLSNAEIAERLYISPRTVEAHRANFMRKLSLATQTDLIRYAIRRGIIPTTSS